jgi:hypothetical protein
METTFHIAKLILAMTGIWMLYSSTKKQSKPWYFSTGCSLFGLALFMTGVEFMSPVDNAWTYWLFEAGQDDYIKALFGGAMMLALPFIFLAVCGKDIINIIESSDNTSSNDTK